MANFEIPFAPSVRDAGAMVGQGGRKGPFATLDRWREANRKLGGSEVFPRKNFAAIPFRFT